MMVEPNDIMGRMGGLANAYREGLQAGYAGHGREDIVARRSAWGRALIRAYGTGYEHGEWLREDEQREAGGMQ